MSTTTRIEITARPSGGPRVTLRSGPLQVRRLRSTGPGLRLALVAGQALLLAGDRVRVEVAVDGPVEIDLTEPAGTVAYDMRGGPGARWDVQVRLRGGASLAWEGQPFVVATGAEVVRDLDVDLEEGCRATLHEVLVLGRVGETGGDLVSRTRATYAGRPLLVEEIDLSPRARAGWATMHGHRCLDSTMTVGHRLAAGQGVLQLDGPGSIHRWIGHELHRAEAAPAS